MGKTRNKRTMLLGYISIACLSSVIILFSIYSINKVGRESDFIVNKILPAKTFSSEILTSLINQETGIRAYIISEDKDFLEPYYLENMKVRGYYDSLDNLKDTPLGIGTTNELSQQMKSIQIFFEQQIELVNNGESYQAKLNLNRGKDLVDRFRATDNILINKINLEVNSSRNQVATTRITQRYLFSFLGFVFILGNLIFINYIWSFMHEEVKRKNKINKDLYKSINSQEEFIANISHEVKTPLNVIFSVIQLFQMYCYDNSLNERREAIVKYLDSMKLNAYRLSKLINNVVDASKIQAGFFKLNLSNNNIVAVVEKIVMSVSNFSDIKGVNIRFDAFTKEKIIACDPEKIDRIVLNLLSNAIKFSNRDNDIFVDVSEKSEFIIISVKDNGIGIEANNLKMIFDRFKQVNVSHSKDAQEEGNGLSLVRAIVELQGGKVYAESEVGKGSKFTVMIPSGKGLQESVVYNSDIRSEDEMIRVELSDIYL